MHAIGVRLSHQPWSTDWELALPGGRQVSKDIHGVLREGCSVPLTTRWEGRSGLQEATGASQEAPAAQVRHHAKELLRSVDPSVPLRATVSTAPSKMGPEPQSLLL